jgi:hypothetical protein
MNAAISPNIPPPLGATAKVYFLSLHTTPRKHKSSEIWHSCQSRTCHFSLSHLTHLPTGFVKDTPAKFSQTSNMQGGQLYIRYLHLRPASQTMQRMPAPCFLYTSTRRRTQSPLRTVTTQDRAEKVQPIVRSRRRLQDPSQPLVRDVLSDALSSRSRIILLPRWRSPVSRSRHDDTARTRH